jgi:hypothetical protein
MLHPTGLRLWLHAVAIFDGLNQITHKLKIFPKLILRRVNHRVFERLMRRREEREAVGDRHLVAVHVVAHRQRLIADEIKQNVNRVIARTATVRESGVAGRRRSFAETDARVRRRQILTEGNRR